MSLAVCLVPRTVTTAGADGSPGVAAAGAPAGAADCGSGADAGAWAVACA